MEPCTYRDELQRETVNHWRDGKETETQPFYPSVNVNVNLGC